MDVLYLCNRTSNLNRNFNIDLHMKKYLLIISLFVCQQLAAGPVTQEQAQQKAKEFIADKMGTTGALRRAPLTLSSTAVSVVADAPLYIFNIDSNGGYVIVSGDDRTYEVLGYSTSGHLDEKNMPENMREVLQQYIKVINRIQLENISVASSRNVSRRAAKAAIEPLLKSEWDQSLPYNAFTPQSDKCDARDLYHCATGCVATAMAQLMYYHQWPAQTTTIIPAYTSEGDVGTFNLEAIPAGTPIQWNVMQDKYNYSYSGTDAENAVANLMKYCGYSVEMGYGTSSGAPTSWVPEALVDYFDYEESTARFIYRTNYSYDQWQNIIYQELEAKRPVLFSGQSSTSGHAFICDGYDSDDLYHINWGWGGRSNGFFRLNVLYSKEQGTGGSNSELGYCLGNGIGIGIQPNDGIVTPKEPLMTADNITLSGSQTDFTRNNASQSFTGIQIKYAAWNEMNSAYTFDVGARIIDSNGKTMADFTDLTNCSIGEGYGWGDRPMDITVSNTLPNGEYRIILTSRVTGSGAMKADYDSDGVYLPFTISGNTLHFHQPALQVVTSSVTGNGKANSPQTLSVTIRNNGDIYCSDLYYYLNRSQENPKEYESYQGAAFIELSKGEETTIQFNVTPKKSGTNVVTLVATKGNIELGTFNIEVSGSAKPVFSTASVANYDAEKNVVNSKTFDITLRLTNEGEASYSEAVEVSLINYDSYTLYSQTKTTWNGFDLGPGESTEMQFVFENLTAKTNYCVYIVYTVNGEQRAQWGDVFYLDAKVANLELTDGASDANIIANYTYDAESKTGFVGGKDCNINVDLKNTGDEDFNGYVWTYVRGYSSVNDTWFGLNGVGESKQLDIPIGETKTFTASFSDTYIQRGFSSYGFNKYQVIIRYGDAVDNMNGKDIYTSPEFQFGDPEPVFSVANVAKANTDGNIVGSTFDVTVQLENKGKAPYKESLYTVIEYYNGNDIWVNSKTYAAWNVSLASGATDSKQFKLDNAKQYNSYRVKIWSSEDEVVYCTPFYKIVAETPQPYLNMATTIENSTYNSEDRMNHLAGTTVAYTVKVENLGDASYSTTSIAADLMVYNKDTGKYNYKRNKYPTQYINDVNLSADQYFNTPVVWEGLEIGNVYCVMFTYTLDGNSKMQLGSSFIVDPTTIKGDANNDGLVNANDVVSIADKVIGKDIAGFNEVNADVNGDSQINVADAVALTRLIDDGVASAPRRVTEQEPATDNSVRQLLTSPVKVINPQLQEDRRLYVPTFVRGN